MSSAATKPHVEFSSIAGQQSYAGGVFPLVYECGNAAADLESSCAWIRGRTEQLLDEACRHGAVFFRGFPLRSAEDFDRRASGSIAQCDQPL